MPLRKGPGSARWKAWSFRLATLVAAPLLTIGAIEATLRVADYGHPTAFWIPGVGPAMNSNSALRQRKRS